MKDESLFFTWLHTIKLLEIYLNFEKLLGLLKNVKTLGEISLFFTWLNRWNRTALYLQMHQSRQERWSWGYCRLLSYSYSDFID